MAILNFFQSLGGSMPSVIAQGLIWGVMAIGVYITFRILDIADLTVDGSLATGGAVCVILISSGVNPWLALLYKPPYHGRLCLHKIEYSSSL